VSTATQLRYASAEKTRPLTEGGLCGLVTMVVPHWLISLGIFALLGAFIAFAFRQGQKVKPDRNKDPDEWTRYGGGDHTGI
jgi:hypothetical protein